MIVQNNVPRQLVIVTADSSDQSSNKLSSYLTSLHRLDENATVLLPLHPHYHTTAPSHHLLQLFALSILAELIASGNPMTNCVGV